MQVNAQVEFVDGAGYVHEVAQVSDGAFAIAREQSRGLARFPSAARGQPSRRGEMMQRHDRFQPVLLARGEHPPVVFELRERKLTLFGFDTRPFDREAVSVEAKFCEQRHIIRVAMVMIAGVARGFGVDSTIEMLEQPRIAVYIP